VEAYGRLQGSVPQAQLKMAESWLGSHPASPALNLALARLCRTLRIWGKAEDYLHRALAFGAGVPAWEELGRAFLDQGDGERAARAFANAVAVARGERLSALSGRASREDFLAPVAVRRCATSTACRGCRRLRDRVERDRVAFQRARIAQARRSIPRIRIRARR
jgi:hypothetical protein